MIRILETSLDITTLSMIHMTKTEGWRLMQSTYNKKKNKGELERIPSVSNKPIRNLSWEIN